MTCGQNTPKLKNAPLLINEEFLPYAKTLVSEARHFIYITTFKAEIIDKPRGRRLNGFFELLVAKLADGVDVKLITNKASNKGFIPTTNFHAMQVLSNAGVQVRTLPSGRICHAKIILVDGFRAIIGSHNLSVKSCHNNFEVSYMVTGTHTVSTLKEVFCNTWGLCEKI